MLIVAGPQQCLVDLRCAIDQVKVYHPTAIVNEATYEEALAVIRSTIRKHTIIVK